ncbi:OmpA family protein [Bradyrhizobium sp. 2TAF24]|uniref:OmpA family protein n=1 Tax=Bradyrhizobium sp. 2TAF24 TaxID=3233011 RepID=UPI003F913420
MLTSFRAATSAPRRVAMAGGLVLALSGGYALAGDGVSSDQILNALTAKPRVTRSMAAPHPDQAAAAAESKFIASLRNRPTRSLSLTERDEIATIARDKPNIELEITFDYNSADISAKALPQVEALGKALSDPALRGATFVVAGYTDASGGEAYNQDLSERRADSIKHALVEKYGVTAADLVTVGYGKTKLKNPDNPTDPANRRVQVVTMTDKAPTQ